MNNIAVHLYECEECVLLFAVEQALEDQSSICCPNCGEENLTDVAAGEVVVNKKPPAPTGDLEKNIFDNSISQQKGE